MANQIVVSAGAKVRNLDGVLTGTSGVVNSLPINASNGIPQLDVNGKILVSQLPNSVMEYQGTWNAATNTPTLANGTGNQGDVYLCNVAGTVDFGAGPIAFVVGDQVIYSGSIWQRASGATGTVTSVAITESGDSLNITGSPITTSGTINIGFNGTNLQYVNGAGNLTTFPTLITSIGLSMPSAFSVANSPLTANGTIAVTGAGTTAQYIRGDGSLATFPTIATEAQRLITEVYNETGATLSKGTVVYINGGHGNLPTITKALATGDATSAQTYGIVQTDITNMNNGYVVVIGSLTDLDTSAYVEGTQLYLSSTTAGAWTSVKQYAPAHLVYVAIVTRSHPTQGVVEVRIQNGFEMDELHNVSAQSPLNNQGLFYNTSTSLWENKSIATALGYTPADDSLVVKLAGTQTITGAKTFDAAYFNGAEFINTAYFDKGLWLVKNGIPSVFTALQTTIYSESTSNNVIFRDNVSKAKLVFDNSTQTYTFPAASGTIALTSDIPSLAGYVTLATTQTITGAKTFSGAVTLTSSVTTNNLTFANSGFFLTLQPPTLSVNRTVTLPDATGTLALTTDIPSITGLVPYTGATGAVDLGIYNLTSNSLKVDGNTTQGGSLSFKQYVSSSTGGSAGYTGISALGTTQLTISFNTGTTNYKNVVFDVSSITNNTVKYYTLPDATGTIALTSDLTPYALNSEVVKLTGNQTIAGLKTFSVYTTHEQGALIKHGINLLQAGYTGIGASTLGLVIGLAGGGLASLNFNNTTSYTYTFPNATGTIALTSDLTGGTVTSVSALTIGTTGTDLSSSVANSTTTPVITLNVPTASATNRGALSSADWTTFNNKQSALTNPVTGTGTTNYLPKFTGTSTIGNSAITDDGTTVTLVSRALSGTSATFIVNSSSTITLVSAGTDASMIKAGAGDELYLGGNNTWQMRFSGGNILMDNGGNVGINNSSPTYQLDVNGTGRFSGNTNGEQPLQVTNSNSGVSAVALLNLSNDASVAQFVYSSSTYTTGYTGIGANTLAIINRSSTGGGIKFITGGYTDSQTRLTIASTGAATFSSSVTAGGGNFVIHSNGNASIGNSTQIGTLYIAGNTTIATNANIGSNGGYMTLQSAGGNVLIGTTTDYSSKLVVIPSSNPTSSTGSNNQISIGETSNNTGYCLKVGYINTGGGYQGSIQSIAGGSGSTLFLNASGGNVLIGTTSDSGYKLDVNGTGRFSNTVYINNNTGGAGLSMTNTAAPNITGIGSPTRGMILNGLSTTAAATGAAFYFYGATSSYTSLTSGDLLQVTNNDAVKFRLDYTGAATFSSSVTATSFFESSDSRLKTLIQDNYNTKGIGTITPKLYTKNGKVELGYYAQDFIGVLDNAISKGSDDMLSLSYREVHTAKIYALEQEIKELKAKMN